MNTGDEAKVATTEAKLAEAVVVIGALLPFAAVVSSHASISQGQRSALDRAYALLGAKDGEARPE